MYMLLCKVLVWFVILDLCTVSTKLVLNNQPLTLNLIRIISLITVRSVRLLKSESAIGNYDKKVV